MSKQISAKSENEIMKKFIVDLLNKKMERINGGQTVYEKIVKFLPDGRIILEGCFDNYYYERTCYDLTGDYEVWSDWYDTIHHTGPVGQIHAY